MINIKRRSLIVGFFAEGVGFTRVNAAFLKVDSTKETRALAAWGEHQL